MSHIKVEDRVRERASRVLARTIKMGLLAGAVSFAAAAGAQQSTSTAQTDDLKVQSAVTQALAGDGQLRGQSITASVSGGVVTLSGNVADDAQRIAAEQTAAQIAGVRSINDGIVVAGAANTAGDMAQGAAPNGAPGPNQVAPEAQAQGSMPPPPPAEGGVAQQGQGGQYPPPPPQYGYPAARPGQTAPYQAGGDPYGTPPASYVPGVTAQRQNTSGPVTLTPGLLLSVRTSEPLSTGALKGGEYVQFTAASDVYANGVVAIPRGAVLTGQVVEAKNAGPFGGSPRLDLKLTTVQLGGQTYPIASDVWSSQGPSKSGYTATNTVGGAAFGALIGAVAGGGVGAGVGAVAGGASGALISGATHGPRLDLPAEALLQFHLTAPLTVQPVSYDEAARLAASVPQQPVLRQRPMYVRAPYPYYPRAYYVYPAPYPYRVY